MTKSAKAWEDLSRGRSALRRAQVSSLVPARHGPDEHQIQVAVVEWAKTMEGQIPALRLLHAVPNAGKRGKAAAGRMIAEGLKAGIPDLSLPVARGGFSGLAIELKANEESKPTAAQVRMITALQEEGSLVVVCWSVTSAIETLKRYLALPVARFEFA